jgi:hypothetical protein
VRAHEIVIEDTIDNHTKAVYCSCGFHALAFFGDAHAETIVERHFAAVGVEQKVMIL